MRIDFTMTAMCRPDITARTLLSFSQRLAGIVLKDQTIYVNVDPLPADRDAGEVLTVLKSHFRTVRAFLPVKPSFPAALKWCWTQPETPYFFHLEDDWVLTEHVSIQTMLDVFAKTPKLSCVNLRAYDFAPNDSRICLSPCLMRSVDAGIMATRLSLTANPEKQLRPKNRDNPEGGKHGSFESRTIPEQGRRVLEDIGRNWLASSAYAKDTPGDVAHWTTWKERSWFTTLRKEEI